MEEENIVDSARHRRVVSVERMGPGVTGLGDREEARHGYPRLVEFILGGVRPLNVGMVGDEESGIEVPGCDKLVSALCELLGEL